jgi:putative cell wall-binding protein
MGSVEGVVMEHSAASVRATHRWSVRTAVPLIAGFALVVGSIVLNAAPATAGTCMIDGTAVTTVASQAECDALVALYISTDGPNWDITTGWNTPTDPCGWYGVTCEAGVTYVDLSYNWLSGPVPPEIGDLAGLEALNLSHNQLSSIPPEIGDLASLELLDLGNNQLSSIPPEIGDLTNLTDLYLWVNELSGVPPEIGDLASLELLGLGNNQLSSIPPEIGGLANLRGLYLRENELSGVPPEIGDLAGLEILNLSHNQLFSLPPEIGNLTNLKILNLPFNLLSGDITAPMTGIQDTVETPYVSDGPGGNSCLSVTDTSLAEWLTGMDPGWDECGVVDVVVVGGPSVVSNSVLTELDGLVSGSVTRVWGSNRYATAAALSNANFAPGVSTVFIATGENFPDALAAGPAAGIEDSPILLVRQNAVPSETAAELTRLSPSRIVVAGGPAVVSDGVMTTLDGFTSGTVTRMWGANRYATAAAVSAATFSPGVSTVYVATGANFPDALAGGPAGVINDGPILLVRQNAVPSETAAELARLHPATIVVLGGPAVVSSGVVTQLEGMASSGVSRLWGANRYATAVAVSEAVFATGANAVFIVTGVNFPDAVAAGPVAGMLDAPILLVTGTSVPTPTQAEVTRLAQ